MFRSSSAAGACCVLSQPDTPPLPAPAAHSLIHKNSPSGAPGGAPDVRREMQDKPCKLLLMLSGSGHHSVTSVERGNHIQSFLPPIPLLRPIME